MAHKERPLDKAKWLGASCHNLREVEHAITLGIDYLFLSPVLQTQSHPGLKNIGWREFTVIARQIDVPTYALGGMQCAHLTQAQLAGAKGIAGISAFWN
jgi:8-oxo-dGTP diphosphatase